MERRTEKIRIRFTPSEAEHLRKESVIFHEKKRGGGRENFSEYLREQLLGASNYKNESIQQQLKDLRYELRKIGTNVNQIAKKINGGYGTPNDLEELDEHLKKIEEEFRDYEKAVLEKWESQS